MHKVVHSNSIPAGHLMMENTQAEFDFVYILAFAAHELQLPRHMPPAAHVVLLSEQE